MEGLVKGDALLAVDVQNDFCPGGALPVPDGHHVAVVLGRYAERFAREGLPVFASRDWHPVVSKHFKEWGGRWPPHCVQNTAGAQFHPALKLSPDAIVISAGTDYDEEGYSAFDGHDMDGHTFGGRLREARVKRLFVGGLATDYCVQASVLDALARGYEVVLLLDAVAGIDAEPGDVARALDAMLRAGARTATEATLERELSAPAGAR